LTLLELDSPLVGEVSRAIKKNLELMETVKGMEAHQNKLERDGDHLQGLVDELRQTQTEHKERIGEL